MPVEPVALTPFITVLWVLFGILISLILPLAVGVLRQATGQGERHTFSAQVVTAWQQYIGIGSKYLIIFLAAVFVAIVLVFLLGLKFFTARDAALAGFAWESLVNKLFGKQTDE